MLYWLKMFVEEKFADFQKKQQSTKLNSPETFLAIQYMYFILGNATVLAEVLNSSGCDLTIFSPVPHIVSGDNTNCYMYLSACGFSLSSLLFVCWCTVLAIHYSGPVETSQAHRLGGSGGSNKPPLLLKKARFLRERSASCEKGLLLAKKVRFSGLRCIWLISVYDASCNDLLCMLFIINRAKFRKKLPRTVGEGMALQGVLYFVQSARAHWLYKAFCSDTMLGRKRKVFCTKTLNNMLFMYTGVHRILSNYDCFIGHENTEYRCYIMFKRQQ